VSWDSAESLWVDALFDDANIANLGTSLLDDCGESFLLFAEEQQPVFFPKGSSPATHNGVMPTCFFLVRSLGS